MGNMQINYQPNGSGGGIKAVTEGTVDFGASDMPMTDEQISAYKEKNGGHGVLLFPTVLGAVVPVYNVPGVSRGTELPAHRSGGIFLGKDHDLERSGAGEGQPRRARFLPLRLSLSTVPMEAAPPSASPIICRRSARSGVTRSAKILR